MKVTEKDVAYVADLANLELTDQERQRMLKDLNSILDYIDRLNELDTSDVPPMAQVSARFGQADGKQSDDSAERDDVGKRGQADLSLQVFQRILDLAGFGFGRLALQSNLQLFAGGGFVALLYQRQPVVIAESGVGGIFIYQIL